MELILAFAAGVAVTILVRRLRARTGHVTARDSAQPPTARLQALVGPLAAAGDASAHPRDLLDNPTFREAAGILQSDSAPIDLVTDYAGGANFMLSAAAFAALAERSDRHTVAAAMTKQFRHLSPWPVYYALKYFATLDERPPVGALVLHIPEYWAAHPLMPLMLSELRRKDRTWGHPWVW
jgi:hypothetical protein